MSRVFLICPPKNPIITIGGFIQVGKCEEGPMSASDTVSNIQELASTEATVLTIRPNDTVFSAAEKMFKNHIGCLLVSNEQMKIVGIVSERDIVVKVVVKGLDPKETAVDRIMTRKIVACTLNTSIPRAQRVMAEHGIRHIPVVENGVPVAMISSRDILSHQLATVRAIARKQSRVLNDLEEEHPGITELTRDNSGRIVI